MEYRERLARRDFLSKFIPLDAADDLIRFLKRKHVNKEKLFIKAVAFIPPKNLKLSFFRILGLSQERIIGLLVKHGEKGRSFLGHGTLTAGEIRGLELRIDLDNSPPRHATVYMPDDEALNLSRAQALASISTLVLYPEPIRP